VTTEEWSQIFTEYLSVDFPKFNVVCNIEYDYQTLKPIIHIITTWRTRNKHELGYHLPLDKWEEKEFENLESIKKNIYISLKMEMEKLIEV
jgi:hypothetical protein